MPERDEIIAAHQRRRNNWFVSEFVAFLQKEIVVVHHAMTARAIDPMQFQFVNERWPRHETFQLGHTHARNILEDHVLTHHLDRGVDFGARKTQTLHDLLRHLRANAVVRIEPNAAGLVDG